MTGARPLHNMVETLAEFPEKPDAWARVFGGDLYQIALPPADKEWAWFNPSVIRNTNNQDYLCAVRLAKTPWVYCPASVITIAHIDEFGIPTKIKQLSPPENDREYVPDIYVVHAGAHDCRLFRVGGQLYLTATIWDNTRECLLPNGYTQGRIGLIAVSDELIWQKTTILPSPFEVVEKNWMPIENELSWLYMPDRNIFAAYTAATNKCSFKTIGRCAEVMAGSRGSSQLIKVPGNRLLGVVHYVAERTHNRPNHAQRLRYAHRFVLYDAESKNLVGFSPLFYFITPEGVEFAAGITLTHDNTGVIVSFGYRDTSAWFAAAPLENVMARISTFPCFSAQSD